MHCASCVSAVEKNLRRSEGVTSVSVNLATERAAVWLDNEPSSEQLRSLIDAVRAAGYDAVQTSDAGVSPAQRERGRNEKLRHQRQAIYQSIMYGLPVIALEVAGHWLQSSNRGGAFWRHVLQLLLTLMVFRTAAGPMFVGALRSLLSGAANMDVLIVLGASAAFISGVVGMFPGTHFHVTFHAAAMIIIFVSVGKYLEQRSRGQASSALEALFSRLPRHALRVRDGSTETVPIDEVSPGDILRVASHAVVPVDGEIVSGRATLDESMLTGESLPAERTVSDSIYGGTRVSDGFFDMRAAASGDDSAAARVARLVEEAQTSKPPWQRLADRVAGVFVPCVVVLALATLVGWMIVNREDPAFAVSRAIVVLVVACPCAMGLAIPTAVLVGTSRAAERGILVRDASALEAAGHIREVLLDKTGTLTLGRMTLETVEMLAELDEREVLRLAASLEQFSEHPLAKAVVAAAAERGLTPPDPDEFESSPGGGLRGRVDGREVCLGSASWLLDNQIDASSHAERADALAARGFTPVWVAVERRAVALLCFSDQLHPESAQSIARLRSLGVRVRILSGDRHAAVSHIAAQLGIDEFEAELTPGDKLDRVRELSARGHGVAMVGDGVNDAPALAAADVGIAIGTGADVAREAADICLVGHSPRLIAEAIHLSRRSARVMKQNLFWAFAYNIVMLPVAIMTHLPPAAATAAMMLSSLSVVGNSLRLRRLL